VALKKIRLEDEEDGVPSTALREIALLRELKDQTIVEYRFIIIIFSLKDVVYSDNALYMIFEYFDYDLKKYMMCNPPLTESQVKVREILHNTYSRSHINC